MGYIYFEPPAAIFAAMGVALFLIRGLRRR
jgi:uncharacterized protein (TIGR03382 family)